MKAEPVKFEALVAQKEAIRLDFADASKRFFLLVRREGNTEGQGPLAGAAVQEYGAHDVVPGVGGEPRGYLEFATTDGSKAYIKWVIQAVFVPGPDGKPITNVYQQGWRRGTETVDVKLVFDIESVDPGAVFELRDVTVR